MFVEEEAIHTLISLGIWKLSKLYKQAPIYEENLVFNAPYSLAGALLVEIWDIQKLY